jgi:chromosome segregation ATPase
VSSEPASLETMSDRLLALEAAQRRLEVQLADEQRLRHGLSERLRELQRELGAARDAAGAAEASMVELQEERELLWATRDELQRQVRSLKDEREGLLEEIAAVGAAARADAG